MSGLVNYPCPLKDGRFAHLYLPSDLTAADVRRIIAYVTTLAPEPRAGTEQPEQGPVSPSVSAAP